MGNIETTTKFPRRRIFLVLILTITKENIILYCEVNIH